MIVTPLLAQSNMGQTNNLEPDNPRTTLRINSRAVLVDVVVTDHNGAPVAGLKQDAFSLTEQGKPQTVSFFEEHRAGQQTAPVEIPELPPDVFSNFSPFPPPPAVNVLLLDSLNTRMENQSFVHKQAMTFLKNAKPGSRMAIFTMSLGLHFVQGFTDDPAVLVKALGNKKNNEVETSVMLKGQDESNAQANVIGMMSAAQGNGATAASADAIAALSKFFQENDDSRTVDRVLVTLANLQRLASFLESFPGRKNVIWFSESFPLVISGNVDPQIADELGKTLAMLASARVALYPVYARGVAPYDLYQAQTQLNPSISNNIQMMSTTHDAMAGDDMQRNAAHATMDRLAEETGGKAFKSTNGLSQVIGDISGSSGDFYTVSYTPTNAKMDGTFRVIDVKVAGGKYNLSFRHGYNAVDEDLPGAAQATRNRAVEKLAAQNPGAVDPLLPFMDLGMPQSEQILYKALIKLLPAKAETPSTTDEKTTAKGFPNRYSVNFAIDLKDVYLKLDADGLHKGNLNISLIVYDRYGNVVSRNDHRVALNIKPDVYAVFQNTGVQLHAEIDVPKGNYWLRTGVYDQATHKVGTMEIPLSSVKPLDVAAK